MEQVRPFFFHVENAHDAFGKPGHFGFELFDQLPTRINPDDDKPDKPDKSSCGEPNQLFYRNVFEKKAFECTELENQRHEYEQQKDRKVDDAFGYNGSETFR